MCTHALAPINFRYVQSASPLGGGVVTHLIERPDEVHGCRPGFCKNSVGSVEVLAARGCERIPVRSGHADGRRPAHGERPDRLGDLGRRLAAELELLVRKPALVEQDDRAGLQTNDSFWG
jgi:hypothetical protein